MNRNYNMLRRVSYQQIINTLAKFKEPITYDTLYDNLPCEPDYIVLQDKINKLIEKGIVKKDWNGGCMDRAYYSLAESE